MPDTPPMMAPQVGTPTGAPIRFSIRKEAWSRYSVFGGRGEVWVRAVLLGGIELDTSQLIGGQKPARGSIGLRTSDLVTVFAAPEFMGKPDLRSLDPTDEEKARNIPFDRLEEPENEYLLLGNPERVFTTRLLLTGIKYLPGRFNQLGDPTIFVHKQIVPSLARELLPEDTGV